METEVINFYSIPFVRIDTLNNPDARLIMCRKLLEGYEWYLGFGSVLGFYRDKDFIPQDTDIDFCINADGIDVDKIIQDFKNYFKYCREVKRGDKIHQAAFQDDDNFILDLCFFYKGVSYCEGGRWEDDEEIEWRDTKYGQFPFPKDTEKYLERLYGDWKTPKEDKAIKCSPEKNI